MTTLGPSDSCRENAPYPDSIDAHLTGHEADDRYSEAVVLILGSIGAASVVIAEVEDVLIGGEEWDQSSSRRRSRSREAMEIFEQNTARRAVPLGIRPAIALDVEGVFVGDRREWDEARVNLFPSRATFDQLNAQPLRAEDLAHRIAAINDTYALMTIPVMVQ